MTKIVDSPFPDLSISVDRVLYALQENADGVRAPSGAVVLIHQQTDLVGLQPIDLNPVKYPWSNRPQKLLISNEEDVKFTTLVGANGIAWVRRDQLEQAARWHADAAVFLPVSILIRANFTLFGHGLELKLVTPDDTDESGLPMFLDDDLWSGHLIQNGTYTDHFVASAASFDEVWEHVSKLVHSGVGPVLFGVYEDHLREWTKTMCMIFWLRTYTVSWVSQNVHAQGAGDPASQLEAMGIPQLYHETDEQLLGFPRGWIIAPNPQDHPCNDDHFFNVYDQQGIIRLRQTCDVLAPGHDVHVWIEDSTPAPSDEE